MERVSTLPLAPSVAWGGGYWTIFFKQEMGYGMELVQKFSRVAFGSGLTLTVAPNSGFTNTGTMEAISGGILTLNTTWSSKIGRASGRESAWSWYGAGSWRKYTPRRMDRACRDMSIADERSKENALLT